MEKQEFEDLLKENANRVFHYLLKSGVKHEDAQDIVQDTLYKALLCLPDLTKEKLVPWLFRVAINKHIDQVRKRKRWGEVPIESIILISEKSLEEKVISNEQGEEMKKVFDEMNVMYKHIILLKYNYDLSYKQISTILNIKEESVKVTLYRARNQFKEVFRRVTNEHGK